MEFIKSALSWLLEHLPLELFVAVGSFVEEIIAFIPSPLIMSAAGAVANERGYTWVGYALLVISGSIGKTIASIGLYYIADKSEDVVTSKFGKFLGVTHERIEYVGSWLSRGWWDDVVLFILRALPLLPTFVVSIACGMLKTNKRSFVVATFLGTCVRNATMLYLGAEGSEAVVKLFQQWF